MFGKDLIMSLLMQVQSIFGVNRKVTRNGDFLRLRTHPLLHQLVDFSDSGPEEGLMTFRCCSKRIN